MSTALDTLTALLAARHGHFRYESGHHGHLWLDLDALFARPARLTPLVHDLADRLTVHRPDAVCGPMNGGALIAYAIAERLGVAFYPTERHATHGQMTHGQVAYRVPAGLRPLAEGRRIAVVDDVINAASAVRATLADLDGLGATCVVLGALLTLGSLPDAFAAERRLPLEALAHLANDIWTPAACPLCAQGEPMT